MKQARVGTEEIIAAGRIKVTVRFVHHRFVGRATKLITGCWSRGRVTRVEARVEPLTEFDS